MTKERFEIYNEKTKQIFIDNETCETYSSIDAEKIVDLLNKQENKFNQVLNILEEVDIFSEEALKNDSFAYREMLKFDNKDAYAIALAIKSVIKVIKERDKSDKR